MLLLLGTFVILIMARAPIAFALLISSVAYLTHYGGVPLRVVTQRMAAGPDSFPLLAVPLFIMAGSLMNTGGITERIFDFARTLVGHWTGSLGHVNILASIIFSGMSGAAIADAGGLGVIEIEAMRAEGYDDEFSVAITAASSTIGPIIPPSIPMVVYGVVAGVSVGGLFIGGVIPGLLMALSLGIMVYYYAVKRNYPKHPRATLPELWQSLKSSFLPLMTPVIIIGGIFTGVFTPTEAAVVAVIYAAILGTVIYKELTLQDLHRILLDTVETTASVMLIVATASIFGWILAREQIPQLVAAGLLGVTRNPYALLFLINIFLLIVGCFMETTAALTILIPVLLPTVTSVGVDPLHFGLVMILNLMIGLLTPPLGMVLNVLVSVSKVPFEDVARATMPFLVPLIVVLFLITYIPGLVLWLPRVVMGL
ncbi:MAG: TRAP transporter large permease [Limnochordia bacterium]